MKNSKIAARLAYLSALWDRAGTPRPLDPWHPPDDERADEAWRAQLIDAGQHADLDRLLAWSREHHEDQRAAVRLLQDGGAAGRAARREARAFVEARGLDPVSVTVFGPGWRDAGMVSLREAA